MVKFYDFILVDLQTRKLVMKIGVSSFEENVVAIP